MRDTDEKILNVFDTILSHADQDVARISEPNFRAYLLPVLVDESDDANFDLWLQIAGDYRRPIDVFDPQTNEVLFRVPALVGDVILVDNDSPENSAFEVAMTASRKAQMIPKAGNEYLRREMSKFLKPTGNPTEAQRIWNEIFARYGIERQSPQEAEAVEPTPTASVSTLSSSEVEGYDEI